VAKKVGQAPTSRNPEEGLRFVNQETKWNLRELAMMVRLDLTNSQPTNVSAPITRDFHSCKFVTQLVARASALSAAVSCESA
jgi:hypothetical protein